ncbi:MAG: thiamine-phosphate kinase [Myxococcota bacterium]
MPAPPDDGEDARVARLAARFERSPRDAALALGIGDDAAIAHGLALSVDVAIEGVHFRRDFAPLEVLAARAANAALSDLAAMGARPTGLLLALVAPHAEPQASFDAIAEGVAGAVEAVGAAVVGGNVARGDALSLTSTVFGPAPATPLRRDGARPGEGVWVTGPPGDAALGLSQLLAGVRSGPFVERWLRPMPRFDAGCALAGVASAAMDLSDGLLTDLGRLTRASGVGATLVLGDLPRGPGFDAAAGAEARALLLDGGEGYELVFTLAGTPPFPATRIGTVDAARGLRVDAGEGPRAVRPAGFDHFRRLSSPDPIG